MERAGYIGADAFAISGGTEWGEIVINTGPTGLLGAARPQPSGDGSLMRQRLSEEAWCVTSHYVFPGVDRERPSRSRIADSDASSGRQGHATTAGGKPGE